MQIKTINFIISRVAPTILWAVAAGLVVLCIIANAETVVLPGEDVQAALDADNVVILKAGTHLGNLKLTRPGMVLKGQGRNNTVLLGSVTLDSGEPSATLTDFEIRGADIAVTAIDEPRFELRHMKIVAARIGVDMRGNSGGAYIKDLQISAAQTGILIVGALDTVRLDKVHFWPFGVSVDFGLDAWAIHVARCDGLSIQDSLFFRSKGIAIVGASFSMISNTGFDDFGRLIVDDPAARVQISNSYFSITLRWLRSYR